MPIHGSQAVPLAWWKKPGRTQRHEQWCLQGRLLDRRGDQGASVATLPCSGFCEKGYLSHEREAQAGRRGGRQRQAGGSTGTGEAQADQL